MLYLEQTHLSQNIHFKKLSMTMLLSEEKKQLSIPNITYIVWQFLGGGWVKLLINNSSSVSTSIRACTSIATQSSLHRMKRVHMIKSLLTHSFTTRRDVLVNFLLHTKSVILSVKRVNKKQLETPILQAMLFCFTLSVSCVLVSYHFGRHSLPNSPDLTRFNKTFRFLLVPTQPTSCSLRLLLKVIILNCPTFLTSVKLLFFLE